MCGQFTTLCMKGLKSMDEWTPKKKSERQFYQICWGHNAEKLKLSQRFVL